MNYCTKFDKNVKDTVKDLKENCEKCIKEHKKCYYEQAEQIELKRIFDVILLQKHAELLKDLSLETKLQSARLQSC